MTPDDRKELEMFDLAIVANNHACATDANALSFQHGACECDPEVGAVPCRYCAIDSALQRGKRACEALDVAMNQLCRIAHVTPDDHLGALKALDQIQAILKGDRLTEKGEK